MKLYTSNYARNGKHMDAVAISIRAPWWYNRKQYPALAPTWDMVLGVKNGTMTTEEYTVEFNKILSKLDPQAVANELGDGAIMLCYESPNAFCHRHLVAEWMRGAGIDVKELLPEDPKQKQVEDLFSFE